MKLRSLLVLPLLVALLAACGGDSEEDLNDQYIDAMATGLATNDMGVNEAKGRCIAAKFVTTVGADRLEETYGVEKFSAKAGSLAYPELNLTQSEGQAVYDHFGGCGVDMRKLLFAEFSDPEAMGELVALSPEVSDGATKCVEEAGTPEGMRALFVNMIVGDDADGASKVFDRRLEKCFNNYLEEYLADLESSLG